MQDAGFDKNVDVKMSVAVAVAVVRCTRYSDGCLSYSLYNHDYTPYTVPEQREVGEKKKWSDRQVRRREKSFTKLTLSTLVLFFFRSIEEAGRVSAWPVAGQQNNCSGQRAARPCQ